MGDDIGGKDITQGREMISKGWLMSVGGLIVGRGGMKPLITWNGSSRNKRRDGKNSADCEQTYTACKLSSFHFMMHFKLFLTRQIY